MYSFGAFLCVNDVFFLPIVWCMSPKSSLSIHTWAHSKIIKGKGKWWDPRKRMIKTICPVGGSFSGGFTLFVFGMQWNVIECTSVLPFVPRLTFVAKYSGWKDRMVSQLGKYCNECPQCPSSVNQLVPSHHDVASNVTLVQASSPFDSQWTWWLLLAAICVRKAFVRFTSCLQEKSFPSNKYITANS